MGAFSLVWIPRATREHSDRSIARAEAPFSGLSGHSNQVDKGHGRGDTQSSQGDFECQSSINRMFRRRARLSIGQTVGRRGSRRPYRKSLRPTRKSGHGRPMQTDNFPHRSGFGLRSALDRRPHDPTVDRRSFSIFQKIDQNVDCPIEFSIIERADQSSDPTFASKPCGRFEVKYVLVQHRHERGSIRIVANGDHLPHSRQCLDSGRSTGYE